VVVEGGECWGETREIVYNNYGREEADVMENVRRVKRKVTCEGSGGRGCEG
jgi:hypothetical protein